MHETASHKRKRELKRALIFEDWTVQTRNETVMQSLGTLRVITVLERHVTVKDVMHGEREDKVLYWHQGMC